MLNAEKTEILAFHTPRPKNFDIVYNGQRVNIMTMREIKICGIWFCNNKIREYKLNITDKIEKVKSGNVE